MEQQSTVRRGHERSLPSDLKGRPCLGSSLLRSEGCHDHEGRHCRGIRREHASVVQGCGRNGQGLHDRAILVDCRRHGHYRHARQTDDAERLSYLCHWLGRLTRRGHEPVRQDPNWRKWSRVRAWSEGRVRLPSQPSVQRSDHHGDGRRQIQGARYTPDVRQGRSV